MSRISILTHKILTAKGCIAEKIPTFAEQINNFMKPNIRIGYGYDVHQLAEGVPFWLGGIQVPHTHGAVGHSDADVLIHVICDALLGAANLRDIGFHFADTDPKFKGIDSKILLKDVMVLVREAGYEVGNIDCTIWLQQPKVNPHILKMQSVLAAVIGVEDSDVSIKATTTEKLGFVGKLEGVSAHAVALIYKNV
jgi:2-C-methyl-D-erythritol 2,4-cyclodiphosphate synthase